jgi:hypothetical protein
VLIRSRSFIVQRGILQSIKPCWLSQERFSKEGRTLAHQNLWPTATSTFFVIFYSG